MLDILLEWSGTIFLIIGAITIALTRETKKQLFAFFFYQFGCIFYILMAIAIQRWGLLLTQAIFFIINLIGIRKCLNELREKEDD